MRGKQSRRIKSLTKDTSIAIEHTCNGLLTFVSSLIKSGFNFVRLGEFKRDF